MKVVFKRCIFIFFSLVVAAQVQASAILLGGHGDTLSLLLVQDDGSISEIGSWSYSEELDDPLISPIHNIFDIQAHPTNGMVYVSSAQPAYSGDIGSWGNARIDKFTLQGAAITHMGAAIKFDLETFPNDIGDSEDIESGGNSQLTCSGFTSEYTENDVTYTQVGDQMPSDFIFSTDGTRMYIDDDCEDAVIIASVDEAGDAEFIHVGGDTSAHGFAYRDELLYHGAIVFDVSGDTVTQVASDGSGTEQMFLSTGQYAYIRGGSGGSFRIADVAAEVITDVDTVELSGNGILDFATADEATFFLGGREQVGLVEYDGTTLTLLAEQAVDIRVNGDVSTVRGVEAFEAGGSLMGVGAVFSPGDDATFESNGSEFIVYDLSGGSITEVSSFAATGQARAVLLLAEGGVAVVGNNYAIDSGPTVDSGPAVPVPVMAPWLIGALAGILGLFGALIGRRFRS